MSVETIKQPGISRRRFLSESGLIATGIVVSRVGRNIFEANKDYILSRKYQKNLDDPFPEFASSFLYVGGYYLAISRALNILRILAR